MAEYMPITTWKKCPIKSRTISSTRFFDVKFDKDCPESLLCGGLPFETHSKAGVTKSSSSFDWPPDWSPADISKALKAPDKVAQIIQLIPIIEKDSPCYTCTRGNTTAIKVDNAHQPKFRRRKKNAD